MRKCAITPFGVTVKTKLLKAGQTQEWLINQCREKTKMYADSGLMNKLLTGQKRSPRLESAIAEILGMSDQQVV